ALMGARLSAFVLCTAMVSACAPPKPAVAPGPSPLDRLDTATRQLAGGCLDCFTSAFEQFDALRSVPSVAPAAAIGTVRAAILIALRERELGLPDSGHLAIARERLAGASGAPPWLAVVVDAADALPESSAIRNGPLTSEVDLARMRRLRA